MKLYRAPNSYQKIHSERAFSMIRNTYSSITKIILAFLQPLRMPGKSTRDKNPDSRREKIILAADDTADPY